MKPRTKVAFGVTLLVLAGLGVAALIAIPRIARRMAIEAAHERGVEIEFDDLGLGIGWVKLSGVRFSLTGLPAVHGTMRELEVTLAGFDPVGVRVTGMSVEADGSAATLGLGVTEWAKAHPHTFRIPARATEVDLTWRKAQGAEPWIRLLRGAVDRAQNGATFLAEQSVPDVGKIGASWSADDAVVALGFGVTDPSQAPLRIEVRHALAKPTAEITLAPVALEKLAGPFGVALPVQNVTASATVRLEMPKGRSSGIATGTLSAKLEGYVPPHPPELDGFVFGSVTTLDSKLSISEARERADLTETKVTAGAFRLAGSGSVERLQDHGRIRLELKGDLPCAALAGAAADTHLGRALGGIVGQLARELVSGSVGVTVRIDADTRDLPAAKVSRTIGVGCGLRPLKLLDLDPSKLPQWPSSLPPLPSSLPPLPKIELETKPAKPGAEKKGAKPSDG